jgi:hypothetical protein
MNSRRQLETLLGQGFPFLPPACRLVLDRVSQDVVLQSVRASLPSRRPALLPELRALAAEGLLGPETTLGDLLQQLGMEPAGFYAISGAGFTARANGAGLLHLDDPDRLRATASALAAPSLPIPSGSASGIGASGGCSAPSCLAAARAGGP